MGVPSSGYCFKLDVHFKITLIAETSLVERCREKTKIKQSATFK